MRVRAAGSNHFRDCFAAVPWVVRSTQRPQLTAAHSNPVPAAVLTELDNAHAEDNKTDADDEMDDDSEMSEVNTVLTRSTAKPAVAKSSIIVEHCDDSNREAPMPVIAQGAWQQKRAHGQWASVHKLMCGRGRKDTCLAAAVVSASYMSIPQQRL